MLLPFALATALAAANPALGLLETAKEQLARHDDVAARKTLERALPYAADDRLLLGKLYLTLGLAWAEGAYEVRAIDAFTTALKLDRSLTLPPDTSPKIQEWWKEAEDSLPERVEPQPQPEPQPSEPKPEPKPEAKPEPVAAPEPKPAPPGVTEPPPPEAGKPSRAWWAVAPGGVAAICLTVTAVTWKLSDDRYQRLARGTGLEPDEAQSLYASGQSLQSTAQWTAAVGALFIFAAVAVALLIKDD